MSFSSSAPCLLSHEAFLASTFLGLSTPTSTHIQSHLRLHPQNNDPSAAYPAPQNIDTHLLHCSSRPGTFRSVLPSSLSRPSLHTRRLFRPIVHELGSSSMSESRLYCGPHRGAAPTRDPKRRRVVRTQRKKVEPTYASMWMYDGTQFELTSGRLRASGYGGQKAAL